MDINTQEVQQQLEEFRQDAQWFSDHDAELRTQYPDQWVAVYNQEVVGASSDAYALLDDLEAKGVPSNEALIKYLSSKEQTWIFRSAA